MRFDLVEFASLDQGGDGGPVLRASVVAREERAFPGQSDGTDGAFDGVVVEFDAAVV